MPPPGWHSITVYAEPDLLTYIKQLAKQRGEPTYITVLKFMRYGIACAAEHDLLLHEDLGSVDLDG